MVQNVSKAFSYQPTVKEGSYFLCPDRSGESGGLHVHIKDVYSRQCDIVFGAPSGPPIRFDRDAAERMAAFMTELAKALL